PGERHAAGADRARDAARCAHAGRRAPGAGRAVGATASSPGRAVRRRAAAGGGGTRRHVPSASPPGRRADGQPRPGDGRAGPRAAPRAQHRMRLHARGRDAQRRAGGGDGADDASRRRPGRAGRRWLGAAPGQHRRRRRMSREPGGRGGGGGGGVRGRAMGNPGGKGWLGRPVAALALGLAAGRVVAQEEEPSSEPQLLPPTHAPIPGETGTVAKVAIEGNIRVEEDAIRVHLQTQQGQPFDRETVDKDIRAIYGMGFFDQVNAEVTPSPKGITVTFRVSERPLVRNVTVEGNEKLKKEELEGALRIRPHTILDPEKARQGIDAAKKLYADKGYLDAKITYDTVPVGENEIDVRYTV